MLCSSTWEAFRTRGRYSAHRITLTMVSLLSAMASVRIGICLAYCIAAVWRRNIARDVSQTVGNLNVAFINLILVKFIVFAMSFVAR